MAWLSITAGSSGQGDGNVQFNASANADPVTRTGGIVANGQRAQVTQAAGECKFQLSQGEATVPQAGGTGSVDVHASSPLCTWTATSGVSWVSITSGSTGKGSLSVGFTVLATTGASRMGSLTIAGQTFSVKQSGACSFDVSPLVHNVDAGGGTRTVNVNTAAECAWTAASNAPWITITSGTGGSGSGAVTFSAEATNGPARTGAITVAGQTVTIAEGQGCSLALSSNTASVSLAGGSGSFDVRTGDGCSWSATSQVPWITITGVSTGTGNATIRYMVAANDGVQRIGKITVGDQTFTVTQTSGCAITIAPATQSVSVSGGSGSVSVTTNSTCAWTATAAVPWITITAGGSGTGNGTVQFAVAANTGPARSGTIAVGDQTFTIAQDSGCAFTITPASLHVPVAGAPGTVTVTSDGGCAWTALSNVPWITITSGATGAGPGTVQFSIDPNATGAARSGTLTIAGQIFTITQDGS